MQTQSGRNEGWRKKKEVEKVKEEEGSCALVKEEHGGGEGGKRVDSGEGTGEGRCRSGEGAVNKKTIGEERKDELSTAPENEAVEVETSPTKSPSVVIRCKSEGGAASSPNQEEVRGGDETEEGRGEEGGEGGEGTPPLRSAKGDLRGSQARLLEVRVFDLAREKAA
mmetsp:Transcript_18528/g.46631  ORF Transcript_18528/g.46631 Transcript_18528/m.46631 type:complete len:167 (-) Transcript_18528:55-555(-)